MNRGFRQAMVPCKASHIRGKCTPRWDPQGYHGHFSVSVELISTYPASLRFINFSGSAYLES